MFNFKDFCGGSQFLDIDLLWNHNYPRFTRCFRDTALTVSPSVWLWLTSPILLFLVFKWDNVKFKVPAGVLNILKCIFACLVFVTSVVHVIVLVLIHKSQGQTAFKADVVFHSIRGISVIYYIFLMQLIRKAGTVTSGFLFVFWGLELLTKIVVVHQFILDSHELTIIVCLFYIDCCLTFIVFILNCFADPHLYTPDGKVPSSEISASFLSKITFSHATSLLWKGAKTPLVEDNVWELRPDLSSKYVVPKVLYHWSNSLTKFRKNLLEKRKVENRILPINCDTESFNDDDDKRQLINGKNNVKHDAKTGVTQYVSVVSSLAWSFKWEFVGVQFFVVFIIAINFCQPLVLRQLIYFSNKSLPWFKEKWKGYFLAICLFITTFITSVLLQSIFVNLTRIAVKVKASVISLIYRKSLTVSVQSRNTSTLGEIVNLMSVDSQRVFNIALFMWHLWVCPIEIIIALALLYLTLGNAVFAGLATIVLIVPISIVLMVKISKYQTLQMTQKDARVKILGEVLSGIKLLKLYAWECAFEEKIKEIRNKELSYLKMINYMNALSILLWNIVPYLVSLSIFATYVYISPDHYLSPAKAFVSISLLNILRFSINVLPMVITDLIQARVSFTRISKYLCLEDLDTENVQRHSNKDLSVMIEDGNFMWDETLGPCLKDINLRVPNGQLLAIVGQVGSGKSSLISCILGDMHKISGTVSVQGNIAYVPQEAWIQNATLKDNILFGKEHLEEKYNKIVEMCALLPDLDILPARDLTEIGEKGINLSGGQKQRISLARALYSDADIFLLDDPLSAVDVHVGKFIFDNVLGPSGFLSQKTCILVTHGLHWLSHMDEIIVIVDGRISERGSYTALLEHDGPFSRLLNSLNEPNESTANTHQRTEEFEEDEDRQSPVEYDMMGKSPVFTSVLPHSRSPRGSSIGSHGSHEKHIRRRPPCQPANSNDENLIKQNMSNYTNNDDVLVEEEKAEIGGVKWSVYGTYFKAMGILPVSVFAAIFGGSLVASVFTNIWLSWWTDDQLISNSSLINNTDLVMQRNSYYLGIYGAFGVIQAILILVSTLGMAVCYVIGSRRLHNNMLTNVLHCAMSFFDTTPKGRILNRFSKDVDGVDEEIPNVFGMFVESLFTLICVCAVIAYSTPIFLSTIIPVAVFFYLIQKVYLETSRQLKRLLSRTRSPIFNHFSESVTGASVIRAFNVQDRFIQESEKRTDYNHKCLYASFMANRWLGFYLDTLGNLLILAAAMFAVSEKDHLSSGLVGLSISYALEVTGSLVWVMRMGSALENQIVSVERIKEYTEVKNEADWYSSNRPPLNWPSKGEIKINNYMTRYRPGLDLVLKGITVHICPGEKVGVVGRTGAGKSSLTLSLFRIIEAAEGNILIDGRNIADMGLHYLRSNLTILPQDPVVFSGTLRMNLDPLRLYSDAQIWAAVEHAHLKSYVESLPDRLNHECVEGGGNLSAGQKQLFCLARSLLRKTKIIVLDEATAAVDVETDEFIQSTIRREFSDCTVLAIAHRINTIVDYDKILVLDQGKVSEFDSPTVLLNDKNSVFYNMVNNK